LLGNDQYPKTITDLNNVLSNHRFDAISNKAVGKKSPTDNKNKDQKDKGKEEEVLTLSFAQLEGKCSYCGKAGHNSPSCQDMVNKPKDKWAINKAQQRCTDSGIRCQHGSIDYPIVFPRISAGKQG
jgi:hypothetical protein